MRQVKILRMLKKNGAPRTTARGVTCVSLRVLRLGFTRHLALDALAYLIEGLLAEQVQPIPNCPDG